MEFNGRRARLPALLLGSTLLALAACSEDGISTAEAERAAERQVREQLALPPETALATEVFVGRPRNGETVLCGTVRAVGSDPAGLPRRFVASTDPARWLVFEPAHSPLQPSQPNMFAEWATLCSGAHGDEGDEPLAPTERGEER